MTGAQEGDTAAVRRLFRLTALLAPALSFCIAEVADACSIPPPPPPPPRTAAESDAEFEARRRQWYIDIAERQRQEALPRAAAREDRLWGTAQRVVLARIERVGSTRLRGSEGQRFRSPLVTLRPIRWLKGSGSARRLRVHYLSDDSCALGGAGDAARGNVGEVFLLFYRPGRLAPRNILDTFRRDRAVTQRTQRAFEVEAGKVESSSNWPNVTVSFPRRALSTAALASR